MSTSIQPESVSSTDVENDYDIDTIGIEFEYPIAADEEAAPATSGRNSSDLRREVGRGSWRLGLNDVPTGDMTRDHVGAEITSAQLNLHTTQPEVWYVETIQEATDRGYPFAATGYGDTVFGMHLHLSNMSVEKAEQLFELCQEDWFRIFACTSVDEDSADPWRHGGVSGDDLNGDRPFDRNRCVNSRRGSGHYEWRLPEPMLPDHFEMMMRFLRTLEIEGFEAAYEYAYDAVHRCDERLTAIQQYQTYSDRIDDYDEVATTDDNGTDPEAAEYLVNLMNDA